MAALVILGQINWEKLGGSLAKDSAQAVKEESPGETLGDLPGPGTPQSSALVTQSFTTRTQVPNHPRGSKSTKVALNYHGRRNCSARREQHTSVSVTAALAEAADRSGRLFSVRHALE